MTNFDANSESESFERRFGAFELEPTEQDKNSRLLDMEVVVKNTFVHLQACTGRALRRSGSAPAAARGLADEGQAGPKEKLRPDVWADASTATGLSEDDMDSESHDKSPLTSSRPRRIGVAPRAPGAASAEAGGQADARGGGQRAGRRRGDPGAPHSRTPPLSPSPSPPPSQPDSPPLPRGKGKAASDTGSAVELPNAGDLMRQLAMVVAAASSALAGSAFVQEATTSQGSRGWTIVVKMTPEHAKHRESVLSLAKDALLAAARDSQCAYVLGYLAQPFVCSPLGFAAELGAEPDHAKACWGLLGQGFCRRGAACRRRHPKQQATLNVIVQQAVPRRSST